MRRLAEIFIQPFDHWNKMMVFKKVLYGFLIFNTLTLLPIANEIFGYHGIIGTAGWHTGIPWYLQGSRGLTNILSHPYNSTYQWISYFFIFGQLVALGFGFFNRFPKMAAVLVYFFTVNLFNKGYLVFTGGEFLINLILFYLIFIQRSDKKRDGNPEFSPLQNVLNNTFYWVILIQVCVLYFFSNLFKLMDPLWQGGEALMYISRIDAYSSAPMRFLFADNLTLSIIGTYLVLIYQGLFPILVWFKRIKIPLLTVGVLLHLGIAFGMGIFTFGIIMIIAYIPFLSDVQVRKMQKMFSRKSNLG